MLKGQQFPVQQIGIRQEFSDRVFVRYSNSSGIEVVSEEPVIVMDLNLG